VVKVFQIRIGKHQTGIIGLEEALKEMSEEKQILLDQNIGTRMVEKLSKKIIFHLRSLMPISRHSCVSIKNLLASPF